MVSYEAYKDYDVFSSCFLLEIMNPSMLKNLDDFFPKANSVFSNTMEPSYYNEILDQDLVDVIESMGQIRFTRMRAIYEIGHEVSVDKLKLKDVIDCPNWGKTKNLHQIMSFLKISESKVKLGSYWLKLYMRSQKYPFVSISQKVLSFFTANLEESKFFFCRSVSQIYRNNTDVILEKENLNVSQAKINFPSIKNKEVEGLGLAIALNNDILKSQFLHNIRDKASTVFKGLMIRQLVNHNSTTEVINQQLTPLEAYRTLTGKSSDDFKHLLRFDESNSLDSLKIKYLHLNKSFNQTTFYDLFEGIVKVDKSMDEYIDRPVGQLSASLNKNWLEFIRGKAVDGLSNISARPQDFFNRIANGNKDGIMGTMENSYFTNWFKFTEKKKFMFLSSRDLRSRLNSLSAAEERVSRHYWSLSVLQLHKIGLLGPITGTMDELFEPLFSTDEMFKLLGGPVVKYIKRASPVMSRGFDLEKPMKNNILVLKSHGSTCKHI